MESQRVETFSYGLFSHEDADVKVPAGALIVAREVYVDNGGTLRGRSRLAQKIAKQLVTITPTNIDGNFVWAGSLLPGHREMWQGIGGGAFVDAAGTGGIAFVFVPTDQASAAVFGNTLVLPTGDAASGYACLIWGGARKADAALSNVVHTQGSAVITRAAGGFTAALEVGHIIYQWDAGGTGWAVVKSVDSDTQVTMDRPWTRATGTFTETWQRAAAGGLFTVTNTPIQFVGSIAGRAVIMGKNQLRFSDGPDPTTGAPRTNSWPARNLHEFPVEAQGIALAALRDQEFVFTTAGVFIVSGMAQEIVDPDGNAQHPIQLYSAETIALSGKGIVSWEGVLIVPCRDGIYIMDGLSAPIEITRGIPWANMVRGGLTCGWATVYKGMYLLPVDYGGEVFTIVIRLAPVASPAGDLFPTTEFHVPGSVRAWAVSAPDSLIGAAAGGAGLLEGNGMFTSGGTGVDYDGADVGGKARLRFRLGTKGVLRRVRARSKTNPDNINSQLRISIFRATGVFVTSNDLPGSDGVNWQAADVLPTEGEIVDVELQRLIPTPDWTIAGVEAQYVQSGMGF